MYKGFTMRISNLFFSLTLLITTPILSMEPTHKTTINETNETKPSPLMDLNKDISIIIVACCEAKDTLRKTCTYFRDFASTKNLDILRHDSLQLSEEALHKFTLYYGALGNSAIVGNLLAKGANPNVHDSKGIPLMHYVVQYGYADIVDMLLIHPDLPKTTLAQNEDSPFYLAMKYNQNKIIEKILSTCTIDGGQALCYAAKEGLLNTVRTLLACKIDTNSLGNKGAPPLVLSIRTPPITKLLIINGAHIDYAIKAPQGGMNLSALSAAIVTSNPNAVQLLLEHKANSNTKIPENNTLLHLVSAEGKLEIIKILLNYGALINTRNDNGKTPADVAKTDEIKQFLIEHEKNPHKLNKVNPENNKLIPVNSDQKALERSMFYHGVLGDCAMVHDLLSQGIDPNICDEANMSVMHYAAQYGYLDIVDLLLKHPALITTHIADGEKSPFYLAIEHNQNTIITRMLETCAVNDCQVLCHAIRRGLLNTIDTLLTNKIDANAVDKVCGFPLFVATVIGDVNLPIMQLLINNGAIIDQCVEEHTDPVFIGATSLHLAANLGYIHAAQLLIDYGADVNVKTINDITPLHSAAVAKCSSIVKMLLSKGARVNERNDEGKTALHCALTALDATQMLLACPEINVNEKDNDGNTPLHIAIQSVVILWQNDYKLDIIDALLKHPTIIVNAENNGNKTPLDIAVHKDIVDRLIKHGGKTHSEIVESSKTRNKIVKKSKTRHKTVGYCVVQ